MKEKISLIYILLTFITICTYNIPSLKINFLIRAETTATEDSQPTQEFKENLEQMVAEKIKSIIDAKEKKGWIGTIIAKDETSIKIETETNETREILLDSETTVISPTRQIVGLDGLIVGKRILAMGYLNGENLLLGKRIQILDKSETRDRFSTLGVVSDKSISEKIITLTPIKNKDLTLQLNLNQQTVIKSLAGNRLSYENLNLGDKIAAVYQEVEEEKKAVLVVVVSPAPIPSPTPEATNN